MIMPQQPAINKECRPGDVGRVLRCEEGGQPGDIPGRAEPAQRDLAQEHFQEFRIVEQGLVDRCLDGARRDVVHGNAERREFDGQIAAQHLHRAFARAVGREMRKRQFLVDGADVDDAPGALRGPEMIDEILRDEKCSAQIDPQHEIKILLGDIPELRPALDARVVHEDVDLPQLRDPLGDDPAIVRRVAQVALHRDGAPPKFADGLERLLGAFPDDPVIDDDVGALLREPDGNRLADALSAAGHAGHFSGELWRRRVAHVRGRRYTQDRTQCKLAECADAEPNVRCEGWCERLFPSCPWERSLASWGKSIRGGLNPPRALILYEAKPQPQNVVPK